jgi:hypothetical protein
VISSFPNFKGKVHVLLLYISGLDDTENREIYKTYMHFDQITCIGKKAPVWKSTNFDAGLYDITGFF